MKVGELSILESSARLECQKMQQKIASLLSAHERLQMHLSASRERETKYEVKLGIEQEKINEKEKEKEKEKELNRIAGSSSSGAGSTLGLSLGPGIGSGFESHNILNSSSSSREIELLGDLDGGNWSRSVRDDNGINGHPLVTSEIDSTIVPNSFQNKDPGPGSGMGTGKGEDGELKGNLENSSEGATINKMEVITSTSPDPSLCLLTLKQVQERAKETQIELDEARGSLNDLILEIEAVSVEEGRSREQSARILRQMADR